MEYAWLGEDYSEVKEPEAIAAGSEVQVEIIKTEVREEKQDVWVTLKVVDVGVLDITPATIPLINSYFRMSRMDEENSEALRKLGNKRFKTAFGITDEDQLNPQSWVGRQAWNSLKLSAGTPEFPDATNWLGKFTIK